MDYVLFIPPPPFFEGTRAEFDTTLEDCWYGRVVRPYGCLSFGCLSFQLGITALFLRR